MLAEAAVGGTEGGRATSRWPFGGEAFNRLLPGMALATSRGLAIVAQFTTQIVVAALAGASGLGMLQLFTSWVSMAGEVMALGLPARAMRQVAVACSHAEVCTIEEILRDSRQRILRLWCWLALLLAPALIWLFIAGGNPKSGVYHWLAIGTLCSAPLFALGRLYAESLKATGAALSAVTLENMISPMTILLFCAGCWLMSQPLLALSLLLGFGASVAVTPVALRFAIARQLRLVSSTPAPAGKAVEARSAALPTGDLPYLWGSGVLSIGFLQMPFLIMPLYLETAEIGVFAMAHKLVNVITTLLLLLAAVYGPRFARCAARQDGRALQHLLWRTQMTSFFLYAPAALLLLALSAQLGGLFGPEFGDMRIFLAILCMGQLVNAATGLCGVLLNMAGFAAQELLALCSTFAVTVIASLLIGPVYGATGLAAVFSGSIALKNLISYYLVSRVLKEMRGSL